MKVDEIKLACCGVSYMGKDVELQKACQNGDSAGVKKILQKHFKHGT